MKYQIFRGTATVFKEYSNEPLMESAACGAN